MVAKQTELSFYPFLVLCLFRVFLLMFFKEYSPESDQQTNISNSSDQTHTVFLFQMFSVLHTEAFIVVVDEVLDALMNHLEETLEAVLSRGENLTLDNKVGKQPSNSLTCVNYTPLVLLRPFLFCCGTTLILLSNLDSVVSSRSSGSSAFSSGSCGS